MTTSITPRFDTRTAPDLAPDADIARVAAEAADRVLAGAWPDRDLATLEACAARDPAATWPAAARLLDYPLCRRALRWYRVIDRMPEAAALAWATDDRRAAALAASVCMTAGEVPPLARALLDHFGAGMWASDELRENALTPPEPVRDFVSFYRAQLAAVDSLATDARPTVRAWALATADALRRLIAEQTRAETGDR